MNNHMLESTADAKAEVDAKIKKNVATMDTTPGGRQAHAGR